MLRETVKQTDTRAQIDSARSIMEIVASTVAERRFMLIMVVAYATWALGIAALGIFGVEAYQVAKRRNEVGIRLALGASPRGLMSLVLIQVGRLALIRLGVFLCNRLLARQLFGLSPYDPLLRISVSVLFLLVALLASYLPARRAATVDSTEALRHG